jgi:hypothetical protein
MTLGGDVSILNSTLSHIHGAGPQSGLMLSGGYVKIENSVIQDINSNGLVVATNLTLINVTTNNMRWSHLYLAGGSLDIDIRIKDCIFDGSVNGSSSTSSGIRADYMALQTLKIENSILKSFERGIRINGQGGDVTIERCTIEDCRFGMTIDLRWGIVVLRGNEITTTSMEGVYGIYLRLGTTSPLINQGNTVRNCYKAFDIAMSYGPSPIQLHNLTIENCTNGIWANGRPTGMIFNVHNSSFVSTDLHFYAEKCTINIYDTYHEPGSGYVYGTGAKITGYSTLSITEVKWRNGPTVKNGILTIEDINHTYIDKVEIDVPDKKTLIGWSMNTTGTMIWTTVVPTFYIDGHPFRSNPFSLWNESSISIELIDDVIPEVTVQSPQNGSFINSSLLTCSGTYWELGSGLSSIEYSLNGDAWNPFTDISMDTWTLVLTDLPDGPHILTIRCVDSVGNVGESPQISFSIYTTQPIINVTSPPNRVNTPTIEIRGTTDPSAELAVNGEPVPLFPNGSFSTTIDLIEGENSILLTATDPAGNGYRVVVDVILDTIQPGLDVLHPLNGTWWNSESILIEGTTEPDAAITIEGEGVPNIQGSFTFPLSLEQGNRSIRIIAVDLAGNLAIRDIVLFIDWTPPVLTLEQPDELSVFTNHNMISVTGSAFDSALRYITIDGNIVIVPDGNFSKSVILDEGDNYIEIRAVDHAGNLDIINLVVIQDVVPPEYDHNLEATGGDIVEIEGTLYCTVSNVVLHVLPNEQVIVTLPDGSSQLSDDEFSINLTLSEGVNEFNFMVEDLAGNSGAPINVRVIYDNTKPFINITSPPPDFRTRDSRVTFTGLTEDGSSLTFNGRAIDVVPGGEFWFYEDLDVGQNTFSLEVTDLVGNTNATEVSVFREEVVEGDEQSYFNWIILALILVIVLIIIWFKRRKLR